jgi:KDO2-lipid IV(A) lauroyltransferase
LIETWVKADPPQYYWVHRRFKTRPEGEPRVY